VGGFAVAGWSGAALGAAAEPEDDETEVLAEVQVTGSRIVRKELESSSPMVIVSSEAFDNRANLAVEDVLNQLPQFAQSLGFGGTFGDRARQSQQGQSATQFTPGGLPSLALDPLNT
jgi:outer membrane cobalamin receptor